MPTPTRRLDRNARQDSWLILFVRTVVPHIGVLRALNPLQASDLRPKGGGRLIDPRRQHHPSRKL